MSNILNLKTGEPFDPAPRLHHREQSSLAVSSSENSARARGMLLAAKSFYIGGRPEPTYDGTAMLWELSETTGLTIELNTSYDSSYGGAHTIDWGDGQTNTYSDSATRTHTYSSVGSYVVQVIGHVSVVRPVLNSSSPPPTISEGTRAYASRWGLKRIYNYTPKNAEIGIGAYGLKSIDASTSTAVSARAMRYAIYLETVSLPIATSVGIYAFMDCNALASLKLGTLTTLGTNWLKNTATSSSSLVVTVGNTMSGLMELTNWDGGCTKDKTKFVCSDGYISYEDGAWVSH